MGEGAWGVPPKEDPGTERTRTLAMLSRLIRPIPLFIFALVLSLAAAMPARAQSDGSKTDDVERTVEFGFEAFAGAAATEFFNGPQGGFGLAFRVKDIVTLRLRNQYFGASGSTQLAKCVFTLANRGCPDNGWSLTGGLVLHPFKFYNHEIKDLWLEPYFAADVGIGDLFDPNDNAEFLIADFLWGLNFDIGRPLVLFVEGGVLYIDFDDKEPQRGSLAQGVLQGGIRFFF